MTAVEHGPVVPSSGAFRPVSPEAVRLVGDGFWADRRAINTAGIMPHAHAWMDRMGWIGNFRTPGTHAGREFTDSEIYKLLEAYCWDDADHATEIAALTALLVEAQDKDGYLGTAYGRDGQQKRWSDPNFGHELYCLGHLIQAGVAAARTGKAPDLVEVARRAADHVTGNATVLCGHPEIETALVELYRVTGEARYLETAKDLIDRRGHRTLPEHEFGWTYFLDDTPVREAHSLRGHAVRALYLAAGAVDVAVETGDTELLDAVIRQFDHALARRTYLTGGMGSRHQDESFGDDFVLPPDRAYSETCAGVATIMLAHRLLLATGDVRYGDVVERVLYNVIATAIADDGRSFFYAHTLHQRTPTEFVPADRAQLRFGGGPRAPFFEVSCCLPNVARLLAGLPGYLATSSAEGVQLHQYANMDVTAGGLRLAVRTHYPDDGDIAIEVRRADQGERVLTLRIPGWAHGATLDGRLVEAGTAVRVRRDFATGDLLRLRLPVSPRWTRPDPRIDAVRGCVAVEAGPLVMCVESLDARQNLDHLMVDASEAPQAAAVKGRFASPTDARWPYRSTGTDRGPATPIVVPLVPYHRWARRGPATMRVWLPVMPS
ncbi:glycoside hydrolase family 127 protein [Catenuloplanes japonicus]|uniref:glycoside hydrolase family 127 protein n=1 Tax=Catenuloplanes japonicus TaxID=33876 RepID=UPI000526B4C3|nr:beta-L-arabinofuranosidase domain-containing protein [Catenuloplanes japonicus]